ncbi:MAG: division/cell wall cluster transcriptional repressor MraZ [Sandaracinaceae bacterium]|jgi:MraZ protein|nr:division/cell wall cluster transcriptional repressor MraZ [Sandaracinaceae bacterium]
MFRGRYEHSIDAKGRTSLPSRFRDVLVASGETKLVITTGIDPCIVAYPMAEWIAFEDRLARLPQFDPEVAMLRRIYVSGAVECDIDKLGRMVIPATLRDHATLARDGLWAGMGKHVELWAKEKFEALRTNALADDQKRAQIARRLAELGL